MQEFSKLASFRIFFFFCLCKNCLNTAFTVEAAVAWTINKRAIQDCMKGVWKVREEKLNSKSTEAAGSAHENFSIYDLY